MGNRNYKIATNVHCTQYIINTIYYNINMQNYAK